MYLSHQNCEQDNKKEKIMQTPQRINSTYQNNQDVRIQFKKDGYENFDVRQQVKKTETMGSQPIIQRELISYKDIALDRIKKIAKSFGCFTDDDVVWAVSCDTYNDFFDIPGKKVGDIFSTMKDLEKHLEKLNTDYGNKIGEDLNDEKEGFNDDLDMLKSALSQALKNLLFPDTRNGRYIFDPGNEDETRSGFVLAEKIMPSIKRDRDYTVGKTEIGAYTSPLNISTGKYEINEGYAAGPKQEVHEVGHVLENKMKVNDYLKVHRFLHARTKSDDLIPKAGWPFMSEIPAYNTFLPELPIYTKQYHREPWIDPISMFFRKIFMGQEAVDKAFAQKSNSEQTHYTSGLYGVGSTELISTSAELFASGEHVMYLIEKDPFRAAFFLYMSRRDNSIQDMPFPEVTFQALSAEYKKIINSKKYSFLGRIKKRPLEEIIHVN